jgi:DNA-directed RNA polymerase subunit RPC12/RpoP
MIHDTCDKHRNLDGVDYCFFYNFNLPIVLENSASCACRFCDYRIFKKEREMSDAQKNVCALRPMRKLRAS